MANKAGVPGSLRRKVMRQGGYRCRRCGLQGYERRWPSGAFTFPTSVKGVHLSIDHIFPRSRGGSSDETNLCVLCTTCNTRKGAKAEAA